MTRPLRLLVDVDLTRASRATLSAEQAHYVTTVMRRRTGDPLLLFNGRDGEWRATVVQSSKRALEVEIGTPSRPQADEPGPALWFAPLKRARQEMLLEKACELGVARLRPVLMRRSVVEKVNLRRQRAILIEAAEQSGRLTVPALEAPTGLDAVVAAALAHPILWADEHAAASRGSEPAVALPDALQEQPEADLLIGPEGGFDEEERALLLGAHGIVRVSLGPRILRAETAAIAALAGWQSVSGTRRRAPARS